ncbi:MAG: PQQ-binding-like beta-propeller repeat protein [Candidatus Kapaibacterium sp.]
MKRIVSTAGMLIAALTTILSTPLSAQSPGDIDSSSVDVTEKVIAMNNEHSKAIPTTWNEGEVSELKLSTKAVKKRANGFEIALPSNAPVPTPTIYDGKLYSSGGFHSKEFFCFDGETGKVIWGVSLNDDGPSSAVVEENVVVFNTESCTIFALDAQTGKHLWSWWLGDPLMSTPTIYDGKVYTSYPRSSPDGSASHIMACFELHTGKVLWQKWIDSDVMSAPVGTDGVIFATTFAGTLYKFDPNSGEILSAVQNRSTSAPVIVNNQIYFTQRADRDGTVREAIARADKTSVSGIVRLNEKDAIYLDQKVQEDSEYKAKGMSLDAGNGFGEGAPSTANAAVAAENIGQGNVSTLQSFQGSRILHADGRNFNTMGDEIICTDPESGDVVWSTKLSGELESTGGFLGTSPLMAGNEIIVATYSGEVRRMSGDSGKVIEAYQIQHPVRSQPAVMNGKIYVGTDDGKIICIDTKEDHLTGWSTWGGNSAHTGIGAK